MERPWEAVLGNLDLLVEVLLRVPAKALLRFKCVSKQWFSLISNPEFCRNHVLRHHNPHSVLSALLFSGDYMPSPHFETVPLSNSGHGSHSSIIRVPNFDYLDVSCAMILRSCNGLLLCSAKFLSSLDDLRWDFYERRKSFERDCSLERFCGPSVDVYGFRYFTCNPTTKQFLRIPIPNWKIPQEINGSVLSLYLAFEPLKSPNYKVVSLRRSADDFRKLRVDIYSSVTGFWSDPGVSFTPPFGMGIAAGVFCKGTIHWYSDDEYSFCFDVDSQCLKPMPMPKTREYRIHRGIGYFGESRDHLHMAVLDIPRLGFDILEMEDDYTGWSTRYHVDFRFLRCWFPELIQDNLYSILCVVRGEKEDDCVVVLLVRGKVVSYNLRYQTLEELQDLESCGIRATSNCINDRFSSLDQNQSGVFQYIESLACV